MTTLARTLLVTVLATTSLATVAHAQPAAPAAAPPSDGLSAQDRDALATAEALASEGSQVLEQWIASQAVTEARLFARLYFPTGKTDPLKYTTAYDTLADRDLVPPQERLLARSPALQYAFITDVNGYVPAHNSRFAQPLTGNNAQDYINNRTKRLLGDLPSLAAARSEAPYLIQRIRLETGDVISEISVPIKVRGKQWGCARVGYRRAE